MKNPAKRKVTKRQNDRDSRTRNVRLRRGASERAGKIKTIPQETKKVRSPSIIPEIPQLELTVEMASANVRETELYMLNEAEFIRAFGWWGLH